MACSLLAWHWSWLPEMTDGGGLGDSCLAAWLPCCLLAWLPCCLAAWLAGWLPGCPVGCPAASGEMKPACQGQNVDELIAREASVDSASWQKLSAAPRQLRARCVVGARPRGPSLQPAPASGVSSPSPGGPRGRPSVGGGEVGASAWLFEFGSGGRKLESKCGRKNESLELHLSSPKHGHARRGVLHFVLAA